MPDKKQNSLQSNPTDAEHSDDLFSFKSSSSDTPISNNELTPIETSVNLSECRLLIRIPNRPHRLGVISRKRRIETATSFYKKP